MFSQEFRDNYNSIKYKVAIYVRLSREDSKKKIESDSIKNQKDYCTNYVINQGWEIIDYYADDDYSGTNFDRPDFKRLLEDMENHKVNMVVTKDLSRFGRDHIESGQYVERYFPEKNFVWALPLWRIGFQAGF